MEDQKLEKKEESNKTLTYVILFSLIIAILFLICAIYVQSSANELIEAIDNSTIENQTTEAILNETIEEVEVNETEDLDKLFNVQPKNSSNGSEIVADFLN